MRRLEIGICALIVVGLLSHAPGARGHVPHDDVADIAMSPGFSLDATVFAVVRGTLFRSVDGGFEWRRMSRGIVCDRESVSGVAVSPTFMRDQTVYLWCRSDVYRSEDGGRSWGVTGGSIEEALTALVVSPGFAHDRTLLTVSKSGGLFRSIDAGASWEEVLPSGASATALVWTREQLVLGTDTGKLYTSIDLGTTWRELSQHPDRARITTIDVFEEEDPGLLVGTETHGVFAVDRSGDRFRPANVGITDPHITSLAHFQRDGRLILLATTWREGVYQSKDRGVSWSLHEEGLQTSDQADEFGDPHFSEVAVSQDGTLLLGSFCGVYRSDNGGRSWRQLETTLNHIISLDVSPPTEDGFSIALSAYGGGVFSTGNEGAHWEFHGRGLRNFRVGPVAYSPTFAQDRTIFTSSWGIVMKSTDGGAYWETTSLRPPKGSMELIKIRALRRIGRKFNSPWVHKLLSWFTAPHYLGFLYPTPIVFAISSRFSSDQTLFVGLHPSGVLRSQDGGSTFSLIWDARGKRVRSLVISPAYPKDTTLFAGLSDGVYRSVDAGGDWELAGGPLDLGRAVLAISPQYDRDRTLFAGGNTGLFRTRDGGATWKRLRIAGRDLPISGLAISPSFLTDGEVLIQVKGGDLFLGRAFGNDFVADPSKASEQGFEFSQLISREGASLIKFSPRYAKDSTVYAASVHALLKSTDGGKSWVEVRTPARYESETAVKENFTFPISAKGDWTQQRARFEYSSTAVIHSSESRASVALHFVGTGVHWIGVEGPEQGRARVFIDDELRDTVDQYAHTRKVLVQSFSATDLPYGPHTLTIEVLGSGSEHSKGARIDIDAFDVEQ